MVDERCPQCDCPMRLHRVGFNKRYMCFERMSNDNNDFCGCTYGAPPKATLTLYVIRNSKGEYYRTYAQGGRRSGWVKELTDARLWTKIGPAKGKITALSNERPNQPVPELVEFIVREVVVVDQKQRVAEAREKKQREHAMEAARRKAEELREAQLEFDEAKARLARLKQAEPHHVDCGCKSCVGM